MFPNFKTFLKIIALNLFILPTFAVKNCDKFIEIGNHYYEKKILANLNGLPADISINWKNDNIYFTLVSHGDKMSIQVYRNDIKRSQAITCEGLGQSSTVDNLNHIVYIASDAGIYKLNEKDFKTELFAAAGEDIMYVDVGDNGKSIIYSKWPKNEVRKMSNNRMKVEYFSNIPNGHGLTIDNYSNIYFVNEKFPYVLKEGDLKPTLINGIPEDKIMDFFVTNNGSVVALDENSNLYRVDVGRSMAYKLGNLGYSDYANTVGIDREDNIILGVREALVKFVQLEENPCREDIEDIQHSNHKRDETPEDTTEENTGTVGTSSVDMGHSFMGETATLVEEYEVNTTFQDE